MAHDLSDNKAYDTFMAAFEQTENTVLHQDKPRTQSRQEGYDRGVARRAADRADWQLSSKTLASPAASLEDVKEEQASACEGHAPAQDGSSDGQERTGTPTRNLATDVAAMLPLPDTSPRGSSPTEDLRASQEAQPPGRPRIPQAPDPSETEINPFVPMQQTLHTMSRQRGSVNKPTKASARQQQVRETKFHQVRQAFLPAMRRAASAVTSSPGIRTRSQRFPVASKAATKKAGPAA